MSREVAGDGPELDFAARFILDEIGIEFEEPDAARLDTIIVPFGMEFPQTDGVLGSGPSHPARCTGRG